MIGTRSALLVTGLLIAAPAVAAQPDGGRYVWVPAGATVMVLPAATAMPAEFPVAHMLAQQAAMMRRLSAEMDSLLATAMPDPEQMIRSVTQGIPQAAPGSGVVVTAISTGSGSCSQTITYGYTGDGGRPTVHVSSSGNARGAFGLSGPIGVMQATPIPQPAVPTTVAPHRERLWTVGDPPRPIAAPVPPRT
jgi:hypothetical protein